MTIFKSVYKIMDSGYGTFFIVLWLLSLTAAVVVFAVLVGLNKVDFGPTGPTGPSGGPTGPTGPAGGTGLQATTATNFMVNQGLNGLNLGLNACNCNNGLGVVNQTVAACHPCQFNTVNGISQTQFIEGGNTPQMINWVLTTNGFNYDGKGTFVLPAGTYQLTTTVVYQNLTNVKHLSIWLRDFSANNVISTSDLIGQPLIVNTQAQSLTKSVTFTVTNKNMLSVLTWHDGLMPLAITSDSQFTLRKVS
jgi:hypothetical protein